jgi:hypothetical protein
MRRFSEEMDRLFEDFGVWRGFAGEQESKSIWSPRTTFDFVLLLIIGAATRNALIGKDYSMIHAGLLIITLVGADALLSIWKWRAFEGANEAMPYRRVGDYGGGPPAPRT